MIVDNIFLNDGNKSRLILAIGAALLLHSAVFVYFSFSPHQKIMPADVFSTATNISIRFVSPITAKPVEPVQKKKVAKAPKPAPAEPQSLNKIEPAAAPPVRATPEPEIITPPELITAQAIPVISDRTITGRRVAPEYPDHALKMRQEGVVLIRVLIDEEGMRQDIKLHVPSQFALLNQAAIKAVKKWSFDPYIINGRATQSWVEIPIEFKIQ